MNTDTARSDDHSSKKRFLVKEQDRLYVSDDTVFQSLGQDHDTVLMSLSDGYLYTSNNTTARFLEAMNGRKTLRELALELEQIYDIEPAKLIADLQAIAGRLLAEGLITIGKPDEIHNP